VKPLLLPFGDKTPVIAPDVFVAPNATVIGDTEIGAGSSIWFGCVLRGDVNSIRIGAGTNIQDGSIVHVTRARYATVIGSGVTIGHLALIHGCRLEDNSFVGMQATVMDGCVIESECVVLIRTNCRISTTLQRITRSWRPVTAISSPPGFNEFLKTAV
jgi:carbonic anhydrase/acetyltransferase-like protein (isoleucine patch superfamily)